MILIVEVWCSPIRTEIYDFNYIERTISSHDYLNDEVSSYLDDSFFTDIFGDQYATIDGLWKVVFELEIHYSCSYEGDYDTEFFVEKEPSRSKCKNFTQLKHVWLRLSGKIEEYYSKPYKIVHVKGFKFI